MTNKKIFLILIILFMAVSGLWWILLYGPLNHDLIREKQKLANLQASFSQAQLAEKNISEVEQQVSKIQQELDNLSEKFVDKNDLSSVMNALKRKAQQYDIKINDFTPVLDSFFNQKGSQKIISLPIRISIEGRYLNIGKFLENWQEFPFYLIPFQIELKKSQPVTNNLIASVMTNLYIWNR